jgi:hypothetical protein
MSVMDKRALVELLAWPFVGLAPGAASAGGAIYAMTNALGNNEIRLYTSHHRGDADINGNDCHRWWG